LRKGELILEGFFLCPVVFYFLKVFGSLVVVEKEVEEAEESRQTALIVHSKWSESIII